MTLSAFDFELPESRIALKPAPERDASRLMVLPRQGEPLHRSFRDIVDFLAEGDMLLLNRTKVLPARLLGRKPDGSALDITLVRDLGGGRWEILSRGRYSGPVDISPELGAEIEGGRTARLDYSGELDEILRKTGSMPLPPYIKRPPDAEDRERYQTVYARDPGSIAAPTAGLHFTEGLLRKLEGKGVSVRYLTLHVGPGTFTPVRAERLRDHAMAPEYFEVESALLEEIRAPRGRLVAVGTTATRAVEGLVSGRFTPSDNGPGEVIKGRTDIFIYPGYRFRAVKALLTNFHLPRSTPLMLTAALAGRERLLQSYAEAVGAGYRFFSYGDAMLIL
ncbi:MAG: tRNA preQ1(34) S-adenosylmethionine ribosyltransferase-isomerase QueA [Nitrospirota bacterium]|jgi:S-adenosylmethionine:tRNA ribosyltransferase-isomerase